MTNDLYDLGIVYSGAHRWRIRCVPQGGRFGRNNCLVNKYGYNLVEFYDLENCHIHGEGGQFVARYDVKVAYERAAANEGLCLHGGVPGWSINAAAMRTTAALCQASLMRTAVLRERGMRADR